MEFNKDLLIIDANKFEEGKDYLFKFCYLSSIDGVYTYSENTSDEYIFINLEYKISITLKPLVYVSDIYNHFTYTITTIINPSLQWFGSKCNIFEIETNEYVLK